MYWLQAYASVVPHKSSNDIRYIKNDFRSHGMSAYHSSHYLKIRLPTFHSKISFSTQRYATLSRHHSQTLQNENIGGC